MAMVKLDEVYVSAWYESMTLQQLYLKSIKLSPVMVKQHEINHKSILDTSF